VNLEAREVDIQKSILHYLVLKGYFVWRNNTGAFGGESRNGKRWWVRSGCKGSGDIIGLTKKGHFLSIEVKRCGRKLTEDQERFMNRINENGGCAFLAMDLQDVIDHGF
jgi:hypothetical protein